MTRSCCIAFVASLLWIATAALADEPGQSPYVAKIVGQEDFVYVWTEGVEGLGDGSDKLVTIGANPERPGYGQVISTHSVGGRFGAYRGGFTDDRRQFWASGLDGSRLFIFDMAADPAHPELIVRIDDFEDRSGGVAGPGTFHAVTGGMLIAGLSNAKGGGRAGLVEFSDRGEFVGTTWMPEGAVFGYDLAVNLHLNRMLTSSFLGRRYYSRNLRKLSRDPKAMENFGHTVVVWDYQARKPLQVLEIPGAPLEVRWALQPRNDHAFTVAALTSRLWGIFRKSDGSFEAVRLAKVGDPSDMPLPVDISLSADDRFLFVDSIDGRVRVFDVSEPREPNLVLDKKIGSRLGRVAQTWDGKRVYFTSSLMGGWDKAGDGDEQFLKAYSWDGDDLEPLFEIDFNARALGRPRGASFGSLAFYRGRVASTHGMD